MGISKSIATRNTTYSPYRAAGRSRPTAAMASVFSSSRSPPSSTATESTVTQAVSMPSAVSRLHAHHLRAAAGNVGIATEVAVYLQSEGRRGQSRRTAGSGGHIVVYRICQLRQIGGTHAFFEKSPRHEPRAVGGLLIAEDPLLFELGQQVVRPLDGACHQLGKVGYEQGKGHEVPLGLHLAPININGVAEGLEGVKGNAHRQDDVQHRRSKGDAHRAAQRRDGFAEEV